MSSTEYPPEPSAYNDLLVGFAGLTALRGVETRGPLDRSYPEGMDGTRTPDNQEAVGHDFKLNDEELRATEIADIDSLEISHYPAVIMDDDIWPENVWVTTHESAGFTKQYVLSKKYNSNDITTSINIEPDGESEKADIDLSDIEQGQIIERLFNGDETLLGAEGPVGDFARRIHVELSSTFEFGANDFELLQAILEKTKQLKPRDPS